MENKINIAELLRDCPNGMELDCTMYDNLYFDKVDTIGDINCYIKSKDGCLIHVTFHKNGCYNTISNAKCVIFPKGKTTWEGFVPPHQFKDGDILVHTQNQRFVMSIYHKEITGFIIETHCILWDKDEGLSVNKEICCYPDNTRLATEEEKEKLFDAIKANGYKWNAETKTLEKLIEPKFKVGNRIKYKNGINKDGVKEGLILSITDDTYDIAVTNNMGVFIPIADQDNWELVPDKFDITTLVPFEDKVLVREGKTDVWQPAFYGFFNQYNKRFYTTSTTWLMCIPYNEDTKHLVGTTNDCDDFYKTWEK